MTLEDAWMNLSWLTTFFLALQLRLWVDSFRSALSSTAGSLATGACRSFYLDDIYGLPDHARSSDIAAFIYFWLHYRRPIRNEAKKTPEEHALAVRPCTPEDKRTPSLHHCSPLVFTHHDLAPRNLLLDKACRLWLVDWEYAGWYPQPWEQAAMQNFVVPGSWSKLARLRWWLFTWLSVGRLTLETIVIQQVQSNYTPSPAGRRWNIKVGTSRSRRPVK
jgi:hypothetical protein